MKAQKKDKKLNLNKLTVSDLNKIFAGTDDGDDTNDQTLSQPITVCTNTGCVYTSRCITTTIKD